MTEGPRAQNASPTRVRAPLLGSTDPHPRFPLAHAQRPRAPQPHTAPHFATRLLGKSKCSTPLNHGSALQNDTPHLAPRGVTVSALARRRIYEGYSVLCGEASPLWKPSHHHPLKRKRMCSATYRHHQCLGWVCNTQRQATSHRCCCGRSSSQRATQLRQGLESHMHEKKITAWQCRALNDCRWCSIVVCVLPSPLHHDSFITTISSGSESCSG